MCDGSAGKRPSNKLQERVCETQSHTETLIYEVCLQFLTGLFVTPFSAPRHHWLLINQQDLCSILRVRFLRSSSSNKIKRRSFAVAVINLTNISSGPWFVLLMCSTCTQRHNLPSLFQRWLVSVSAILYANEV